MFFLFQKFLSSLIIFGRLPKCLKLIMTNLIKFVANFAVKYNEKFSLCNICEIYSFDETDLECKRIQLVTLIV